MDGLLSWIALIAIFTAGIAALRQRWSLAVLPVVLGGMLIATVEDPGGTTFAPGEYPWETALGGLGLR